MGSSPIPATEEKAKPSLFFVLYVSVEQGRGLLDEENVCETGEHFQELGSSLPTRESISEVSEIHFVQAKRTSEEKKIPSR